MLAREQVSRESRVGDQDLEAYESLSISQRSTEAVRTESPFKTVGQPHLARCRGRVVLHLTVHGLGYLFIRPLLKHS